MIGRRRSAFAVGAALVLVLAGMLVLVPGGATAAPEAGAALGVEGDGTASGDGATRLVGSARSPTSDAYGQYEALAEHVPTRSGHVASSRADAGEDTSDQDTSDRLHRWRCPICGASKLSLGAPTGDPDGEAANNLRSHVRNSDGGGHGPPGALPAELTPEVVGDHASVVDLAG